MVGGRRTTTTYNVHQTNAALNILLADGNRNGILNAQGNAFVVL
jgi:hypothetical protein